MNVNRTAKSPEYFAFQESTRFDAGSLISILKGERLGVIFRRLVAPDACNRVAENYWSSPALIKRSDSVPAFNVGAFHYGKNLNDYLAEADAKREEVRRLFIGTSNFTSDLLAELGQNLKQAGITLRPAQHAGRLAGEMIMRSVQSQGAFSIKPHEDGAQLRTKLQEDFEIKGVADHVPVAANFCIANPGDGGDLHLWNWRPDDVDRAHYGLLETGYPYPLESLVGIEELVVPIHSGDVYFFDSGNVHAVDAQVDAAAARLTISFFIGFIDARTVVYWS